MPFHVRRNGVSGRSLALAADWLEATGQERTEQERTGQERMAKTATT